MRFFYNTSLFSIVQSNRYIGTIMRGKAKYGKKSRNNKNQSSERSYNVWKDIKKENEKFQRYYQLQGITKDDQDFQEMLEAFKRDLPTTIRMTTHRGAADTAKIIHDQFIPELQNITYEGNPLEPLRTIPWYPEEHGFELKVPKSIIRKVESLKNFHTFLVNETEAGNISRQEAVSMVPPLLLGVEPHHFVLDMCAAPGSKTAQLLESLHSDTSNPPGLLIANDSDYKRCHLLVHQSLNRLGSPSMMVTNLDASSMASIQFSQDPLYARNQFDRILADVPCTGDGTLRKNQEIWRDWSLRRAIGLHPLQLRILKRAITMLKPGGRLVYSTCSLNPIENEAVVNAAMAYFGQKIRLLPTKDLLPGLIRRPGMSSWKVVSLDDFETIDPPEQGEEFKMDSINRGKVQKLPKSLWPDESTKDRNMEQCIRLLPQDQDTGGFFVALIEKVDDKTTLHDDANLKRKPDERLATPPLESEPKKSKVDSQDDSQELEKDVSTTKEHQEQDQQQEQQQEQQESSSSSKPQPENEKRKTGGDPMYREPPFTFIPPDHEAVKSIVEFFDLSPDFPKDRLCVRNPEGIPTRSLYFTSKSIKDILSLNSESKLRVVSAGVKMFSKQDVTRMAYKCEWRLLADGLETLYPFMGPKRVVKCDLVSLKLLMSTPYPSFEYIDTVSPQFVKDLVPLDTGSAVIEVQPGEQAGGFLPQKLILAIWRSPKGVSLMVDRNERSALSLRVFKEDVSPSKEVLSGMTDSKPDNKDGTTEQSDAVVEQSDQAVDEVTEENNQEEEEDDGTANS